jgi:5S rRNA maturation endonuclease (ribonuclease M5)
MMMVNGEIHGYRLSLMQIQDLLSRLNNIKKSSAGWQACCPSHEDKTASLAVSEGEKGILLNCFAGCSIKDIVETMGLKMSDLFYDDKPAKAKETVYDYTDKKGVLLYQVVRKSGKKFVQRRMVGDTPTYNLKGVRRTIFKLPAVLRAKTVFIVEGERDVETLGKNNIVATCNSGGAGKWEPSFNQYLSNIHVVILPDNDTPGRKHAKDVASGLLGIAKSIKIVELPDLPDKGDVTDYLKSHSKEDLLEVVAEAPEYTGDDREKKVTIFNFDNEIPPPVRWLIKKYIPWNSFMFIGAEQKSHKSFLSFEMAISVITGEPLLGVKPNDTGDVLVYSVEGVTNQKTRLWGLCVGRGVEFSRITPHMHFIKERTLDFTLDDVIDEINAYIVKYGIKLVVIDPFVSTLIDLDENSASDVMKILSKLQRITDENPDCCLLVIDHKNKSHKDRSVGHGLRGTSAKAGQYSGMISLEKTANDAIRKMRTDFRDAPNWSNVGLKFITELPPLGVQEDIVALGRDPLDYLAFRFELCELPDGAANSRKRFNDASMNLVVELLRANNLNVTKTEFVSKIQGVLKCGRTKAYQALGFLLDTGKVDVSKDVETKGKLYLLDSSADESAN